jgi:hypothetical protein
VRVETDGGKLVRRPKCDQRSRADACDCSEESERPQKNGNIG